MRRRRARRESPANCASFSRRGTEARIVLLLQPVVAELEWHMPEKRTLERAARDKRQGKAPSTQAGEFIREEMDHIREGKHGARSSKQAIAIGLSKARRSGVALPPPKSGSSRTKKSAAR